MRLVLQFRRSIMPSDSEDSLSRRAIAHRSGSLDGLTNIGLNAEKSNTIPNLYDAIAAKQLEILDAIDRAALMVEITGRIIRANRSANILFAQNCLIFSELESALSTFARQSMEAPGSPDSLPTATIHREDARPLLATVLLFRKHFAVSCNYALLLITDPDRSPNPDDSVLRGLFGLTPSEARLARLLLTGDDLETTLAGVGVPSIRARQHLEGILRKTGADSFQGLVQLLCKLLHRPP